ncbi:MAG: peptide deformylase, partial [Candidatus Goldbacteria bacterium]|nr:peptide deformylase [Candidatus Goldiibacteriota bacterium]
LSVPDFTGNVTRSENIKVKYIDLKGDEKTLSTSGFEAVVVQHEIDHLDGILFIDRIKNSKRDLFDRKKY